MSSEPDFYLSRKGTVIGKEFREPFILSLLCYWNGEIQVDDF